MDRNKYQQQSRGSAGSWRSGNRGNYQQRRPMAGTFSGEFVEVDRDAKFLKDEEVDGISVVTDLDLVKQMQHKLGRFSNGPTDFFPANWAVSLNSTNLNLLRSAPYVVAPKPDGTRYLFYVDSNGDVYLENQTQNFFRMSEDRAIQLLSSDGRVLKDTVLDGYFVRRICSSGPENQGRLTFIIQDAIRCNGKDLTGLGILRRIDFIEENVMKPRFDFIKTRSIRPEEEAFGLDIAVYKDAHKAETYLKEDVHEFYKYPFIFLLFFPRDKRYTCGACIDLFQWDQKNDEDFHFRLKIQPGKSDIGDLLVVGPGRREMKFDTMNLTSEMKEMDGKIIECRRADHQWIFDHVRTDRSHPNGRRAVNGKLVTQDNPVSREQLLTFLEAAKGLE